MTELEVLAFAAVYGVGLALLYGGAITLMMHDCSRLRDRLGALSCSASGGALLLWGFTWVM